MTIANPTEVWTPRFGLWTLTHLPQMVLTCSKFPLIISKSGWIIWHSCTAGMWSIMLRNTQPLQLLYLTQTAIICGHFNQIWEMLTILYDHSDLFYFTSNFVWIPGCEVIYLSGLQVVMLGWKINNVFETFNLPLSRQCHNSQQSLWIASTVSVEQPQLKQHSTLNPTQLNKTSLL